MDKSVKTVLVIAGVIIAALIIVPVIMGAIFGWQWAGWSMMGTGMMGGLGTMGLMAFGWLAVVGLIIWAVAAAVRGTGQSGFGSANHSDSALEILKKKYARGEIDKAEFEEKKKDLA